MRALLLSLSLFLCSLGWAFGQEGRPPCGPAPKIAKGLQDKYGESPVSIGLQGNGNLLQVWASEERGTWTIVTTTPQGQSCIVAAGRLWENLPSKPPGKDA